MIAIHEKQFQIFGDLIRYGQHILCDWLPINIEPITTENNQFKLDHHIKIVLHDMKRRIPNGESSKNLNLIFYRETLIFKRVTSAWWWRSSEFTLTNLRWDFSLLVHDLFCCWSAMRNWKNGVLYMWNCKHYVLDSWRFQKTY